MQVIFVVAPEYLRREWLGIMYISALLKKHRFKVTVCAADVETICEQVDRDSASVLAYSTPSFLASRYLEFNRELKSRLKTRVWSVFGGPHPTYYPEIVHEEGVDAICLGEGEEAMLEFMCALRDGAIPLQCQNWHVKDEKGRVHENPLRPLNENLDALPFPDRTLFRTPHYMPKWFMVGRGCPYSCTYCFNRAYNKLYGLKRPSIRRRSAQNVIAELTNLRDSGDAFSFQSVDDIFCHPPIEWIQEFAELYARDIGMPMGGNVRANLVSEEVVAALRKARFFAVGMGVESGDQEVRKKVLKRYMSDESIVKAGRMLRQAGIRVTTYNIVGIPSSSFASDIQTLRLNRQFRPFHAICFILGAYKGTEIYDLALSMGMLGEDYVDEMRDASKHLYGWHPHLDYKDPLEALRVENLHKLFPMAVGLPLLHRWVPWLAERRWTKLYVKLSGWYLRSLHMRQILALLGAIHRSGHLREFFISWRNRRKALTRSAR